MIDVGCRITSDELAFFIDLCSRDFMWTEAGSIIVVLNEYSLQCKGYYDT